MGAYGHMEPIWARMDAYVAQLGPYCSMVLVSVDNIGGRLEAVLPLCQKTVADLYGADVSPKGVHLRPFWLHMGPLGPSAFSPLRLAPQFIVVGLLNSRP